MYMYTVHRTVLFSFELARSENYKAAEFLKLYSAKFHHLIYINTVNDLKNSSCIHVHA